MDENNFFIILTSLGFIYALFYFGIGLIASKNIATNKDYFLAGKGLGLWFLTATLAATQLGGGVLLGTSVEAYHVGFYGVIYSLGACLGFVILGCGVAAKLRSLEIATTAEIFEKKYQSPFLRKIASSLSILSLCGILAGQFIGLKAILAAIGVDQIAVSILIWMLIVLCTMGGGLKAVVATDGWQLSFILLTFGGIFIYLIQGQHEASSHALLAMQSSFSSTDLNFNRLLGILLMPALYSLVEQDLAQRFFAARSKKIAMLSALLAGTVVLIFSFIPVYFGMKAHLLGLPLDGGSNPLIKVIAYLTNPVTLSLAVIAIIAAITSTADSLLCAVSSNLVQDFHIMGGQRSVRYSRLVTLGVGVLSLLIGYFFNNIIDVMIQSYELVISCVLVSVIACLFIKDLKKEAAFLSVIFGLLTFTILLWVEIPFPKEIITLIISGMGFMLGHYLEQLKALLHKKNMLKEIARD